MASGGEQQASTSSNQQAPGASNGGAQAAALPCDPQAFAQFFQAFETFYRQCRPGALVLPPEPSQDVIPDTPPNIQGQVLPGPSGANTRSETSNSSRPNTRAQAAISKKATHNSGKGRPLAKGPEKQGGKRKCKKKHTSSKKRRSKQSETEEESGPMDGYWGLGEGNHGIPLWAHERRANSHRRTFNGVLDWKDGSLVEDVKLLGKGEKRRSSGKGRYRTPRAERTFENWLDGYQVFMGVVCAAYPRRAMDLVAYLAHVRRAHALAGEQAALTYDENFRRNASLLPSTRWDLTDPNFWGEDVTPYIERKNQGMVKAGRTEVKRRNW
ncbi:Hypothetical predicted protein [Podarcis lilfordi]|uniref:Uncharacterized protein n=1 Tax=Podarcis lilfordi TaxID=74358 RepID=A0AA35QPU3_9SAUR|nr:Hypothetical predicted protein [Podarcis lilfordi]